VILINYYIFLADPGTPRPKGSVAAFFMGEKGSSPKGSADPPLFSVGEPVAHYWARWMILNKIPAKVNKSNRAAWYAAEITAIDVYPAGSRYGGAPITGRRYCTF